MRVKLRYYLLITSCVPAIMLLNSAFKVFLCGGYSCHPCLIDGAAKTLGSGLIWAIQLQTVNLDFDLLLSESSRLLTEQTWGDYRAGVNLDCQGWSSRH